MKLESKKLDELKLLLEERLGSMGEMRVSSAVLA